MPDTPADRKPRQRAVALSYDETRAPTVVAKGYGNIADAIIERANSSGVYVHQSAELVNLLMNVNLDDCIPEELYVAIAELLCWVYELERQPQS
ncbi:EscU/YscU/HrcU family type III secretion system export apparatus switch protein [Kushneria aurantia]|uniref:Flagellar biosynthetic protein FlhB n=1 Tax=Kushneria aurantia TaxID=504092 RepID=A0ABV6G177_9GAMM|nr:EscU/YscU/HrcU family type III secretion system export apparatus switch protein [Kushneria aurantia]